MFFFFEGFLIQLQIQAEINLDEIIGYLGFASNNPGVGEYRRYKIFSELTNYYS